MTRRGFTLTEVLIGLVLVATIFFGLASTFPPSLCSLNKARHTVAATNLARLYIETWQQKDFASLQATTTPVTIPNLQVDDETYTVVVTVGDVNPPEPDWAKQVDVQVVSSQDGPSSSAARATTCVFNYKNPW
ncbi:MAG: type IV pilus modification PilV family protein [Candidatus Xenobia bacterium]